MIVWRHFEVTHLVESQRLRRSLTAPYSMSALMCPRGFRNWRVKSRDCKRKWEAVVGASLKAYRDLYAHRLEYAWSVGGCMKMSGDQNPGRFRLFASEMHGRINYTRRKLIADPGIDCRCPRRVSCTATTRLRWQPCSVATNYGPIAWENMTERKRRRLG